MTWIIPISEWLRKPGPARYRQARAWRMVAVRLEEIAGGLQVSITNAGRLPAGFDAVRGALHGNGLRIVRSLLPAQGAALKIVQDGESVCARLELRAPVLTGAEYAVHEQAPVEKRQTL